MIGNLLQADLEDLIRSQQWNELRAALSGLDPSDIAELIIDLPSEDEGVIFRVLPRDIAAQVFAYLPTENQEALIASLSSETSRQILDQMPPDDRAHLLEEMPAEVTRRLMAALSPEELRATRAILGYPEDSAGRYMTPEYVAIRPDMTAAQALEHIRTTGRGKETVHTIYIVDAEGRLLDDVLLGTLVMAPPHAKVADLQERPLVALPATATREEFVQAFEKYDRSALPVTDTTGHLLGIITVDDVLDAAEAEATEDMHKLGGMEALETTYAATGFWSMVNKRSGWLVVLFFGQLLTATVITSFQHELDAILFLALFVPLIISSGGNSGSQTASLIIRALATNELRSRDWFRVFRRELFTGFVLGALLGALGFLRVALWHLLGWYNYNPSGDHPHGYLLAGLTVGLALLGCVTFGTLAGSMLPFLLRRLGFDPATSSTPFVATLVDVTGLVIYFTVAYYTVLPLVHPH